MAKKLSIVGNRYSIVVPWSNIGTGNNNIGTGNNIFTGNNIGTENNTGTGNVYLKENEKVSCRDMRTKCRNTCNGRRKKKYNCRDHEFKSKLDRADDERCDVGVGEDGQEQKKGQKENKSAL